MPIQITNRNRVTVAIAGLGPTFSRADIQQAAGVKPGATVIYISEMLRAGWLVVHSAKPGGVKTWRKTAAYQPPSERAGRHAKPLPGTVADERRNQQAAACAALGQLLLGWTSTHWPPKGYAA